MMPTKARGSAMDDGNGMVTLMYRLDTVRHKITMRNRLTTDCNCYCLRSVRIRPKPIQGCPKPTQADRTCRGGRAPRAADPLMPRTRRARPHDPEITRTGTVRTFRQ